MSTIADVVPEKTTIHIKELEVDAICAWLYHPIAWVKYLYRQMVGWTL